MRVVSVLVGATARTGGPPAFVGGAARELARLGHEMPVLATDLAVAPHGLRQRQQRAARSDEIHPDLAAGDTRLFHTRSPRRVARSPDLRRALRREVAGADLVHIHNLWLYPQWAAYRAALVAGVPYVISPHGAFDGYLRDTGRVRKQITMSTWQRRCLERAALIHVTTDAERCAVADIAPGVPRVVVPCGIYVQEFAELPPATAFRECHLEGYEGAMILFLGRVTDKKGIDVLIRSFVGVRAQMDCRLVIVGPDDEGLIPRLSALAETLGVGRDVVFAGPLYGAERLEALAAADVWALSSHTENFGIAVIEAMAAGCPVVVSDGVNLAAAIAEADAGVVCAATPERFAPALLSVLGDENRRRSLAAGSLSFARRYDWCEVGPQLASAYAALLPPMRVPLVVR